MIRRAKVEDVLYIHELQKQIYDSDLIESIELFYEIVTCNESLVYTTETGEIIGYLLAHPMNSTIPLLNETIHTITHPKTRYRLFIHDLAVKYHNRGVGRKLVDVFLKKNRNQMEILLVSVNDTMGFWKKNGFEVVIEKDDEFKKELEKSYGPCNVMRYINEYTFQGRS